jgi:hypothetical protein
VIARNIVTDYASGGVMLSTLSGDSSAIVDDCEFMGTADFYGALALERVADASVTSNDMDGYMYAFLVSGLIQDNAFLEGLSQRREQLVDYRQPHRAIHRAAVVSIRDLSVEFPFQRRDGQHFR